MRICDYCWEVRHHVVSATASITVMSEYEGKEETSVDQIGDFCEEHIGEAQGALQGENIDFIDLR